MSRLTTVSEESLSSASINNLLPYQIKGKTAPVYLQIANSEAALNAYISMENALKSSSLDTMEIEAIKLLVSEHSQCEYCLAIHQMKAATAGLTQEQIIAIRRAEITGIERIDAIIEIVQSFFTRPGTLSDTQISSLRENGFTDAEMVDIALAVATIFFTNNFNHINSTQSQLPPVPSLA